MLRRGLSLLTLFFESAVGRIQYSDPSTRHTHSQEYQPVRWKLLFSVSSLCVLCGSCSFGSFHCVRWPDWRWGEGRALQQPGLSRFAGCPEDTSREGTLTTERCPPGLVPFSIVSIPIYKQVKVMALCKILPLALHSE